MDRLFEMTWGEPASAPTAGVFPAMNVTQDADRYQVRAELPGIRTEDLQISVERNKLVVSGKREMPGESDAVSYHRRERAGGSFSRSLTLPADLDADKVEANYANGVLTITLPKAEAVKARQVTVKAS
ncbi:MAG: Hsp20/alpha crystallin family protein [Bryobacteraceae bacterium]|nr:Hsp20/alpha crystallin family protein [Bryobacteraceae bacterium]